METENDHRQSKFTAIPLTTLTTQYLAHYLIPSLFPLSRRLSYSWSTVFRYPNRYHPLELFQNHQRSFDIIYAPTYFAMVLKSGCITFLFYIFDHICCLRLGPGTSLFQVDSHACFLKLKTIARCRFRKLRFRYV